MVRARAWGGLVASGSVEGDNMNVTVAIYLRGDSLDPSSITRSIGVDPTSAHTKGEITVSSKGQQTQHRTGVWIWSSDPIETENELEPAVAVLSSRFSTDVASLQGVDEAWIDFLVLEQDSSDRSELTFGLTSSNCVALGKLGLPVHITLGLVGEKA